MVSASWSFGRAGAASGGFRVRRDMRADWPSVWLLPLLQERGSQGFLHGWRARLEPAAARSDPIENDEHAGPGILNQRYSHQDEALPDLRE